MDKLDTELELALCQLSTTGFSATSILYVDETGAAEPNKNQI